MAIVRFYENCKNHKPGKKGYPRFQHDNRSVEYKQTGWKVEPDGKHIAFTDGCGIGRLRLVGNKKQSLATFPVKQIKRVRLVRRPSQSYSNRVALAPVISAGPEKADMAARKNRHTDHNAVPGRRSAWMAAERA